MLDIDCQSYSSIDHNVNFIYTYILVSNMYCKYSRFTLQAEVWFLSCMVEHFVKSFALLVMLSGIVGLFIGFWGI